MWRTKHLQKIPGSHFLCDLLKGVKVTVAERYHRQPTMRHDPHDPFGEVTQEVYDARMKAWHLGQEFLKDHSWMLHQFELALDKSNKTGPKMSALNLKRF